MAQRSFDNGGLIVRMQRRGTLTESAQDTQVQSMTPRRHMVVQEVPNQMISYNLCNRIPSCASHCLLQERMKLVIQPPKGGACSRNIGFPKVYPALQVPLVKLVRRTDPLKRSASCRRLTRPWYKHRFVVWCAAHVLGEAAPAEEGGGT